MSFIQPEVSRKLILSRSFVVFHLDHALSHNNSRILTLQRHVCMFSGGTCVPQCIVTALASLSPFINIIHTQWACVGKNHH